MKVLVTGATGLIGTALVKSLAARGDSVIAAVRNVEKAKSLFAGLKNVSIVLWDVTQNAPEGIVTDAIVHAAAKVSSRAFVENPVEVIGSVIDGTRNVLKFAHERNVGRVVFLSTMEIYGFTNDDPVTEKDYGYLDVTDVRSCYPESKRLAENLCVAYWKEYGIPVMIARLSQTFGEGVQRGDKRVFAQFAESIMEGKDIVLHTEGKSARCCCYLGDAVRAIETLIDCGVPGEAYNIANPATYCTIREMAEMLAAAHPPTKVVVDLEGAAGHGYAPVFKMRLATDKLESLGWHPEAGLLESFNRMISAW